MRANRERVTLECRPIDWKCNSRGIQYCGGTWLACSTVPKSHHDANHIKYRKTSMQTKMRFVQKFQVDTVYVYGQFCLGKHDDSPETGDCIPFLWVASTPRIHYNLSKQDGN